MRVLFCLAVLAAMYVSPALAQVIVSPAPVSSIEGMLMTLAVTAVSTAVTAGVAYLSYYLKQKHNIELAAKDQQLIQSAAMTGILLGASRMGVAINPTITDQAKVALIDNAQKYMLHMGAPDAVVRVAAAITDPGVTAERVASAIAESKLSSLVNASATVGVTTAQPGPA